MLNNPNGEFKKKQKILLMEVLEKGLLYKENLSKNTSELFQGLSSMEHTSWGLIFADKTSIYRRVFEGFLSTQKRLLVNIFILKRDPIMIHC